MKKKINGKLNTNWVEMDQKLLKQFKKGCLKLRVKQFCTNVIIYAIYKVWYCNTLGDNYETFILKHTFLMYWILVSESVPSLRVLSQYLLLAKKASNFQKKSKFEKLKFWMYNV